MCFFVGRGSSAGIATRYGLDNPGIEFGWGRNFPHSSRPALGPTQPPIQSIQWVPVLSRGQTGRVMALTTHHMSCIKKKIDGVINSY